jgi:hypothetical protein
MEFILFISSTLFLEMLFMNFWYLDSPLAKEVLFMCKDYRIEDVWASPP